jgi:alanine racemase
MDLYRKTWAIINLDIFNNNLKNLMNYYRDYNYFFAVVKANGYSHGDIEIAQEALKNGINYLAVSSLEEALNIRKELPNINILCLDPISIEQIDIAKNNNIIITIHDLDYLKELVRQNTSNLKIHIKIDTGMNRLGIKDNNSFKEAIAIIINNKYLEIEGLYTHMANADSSDNRYYEYQINNFYTITKDISLDMFKIIHIGNSATLLNHNKPDFVNGIRLGIAMYGLNPLERKLDIVLQPAFSLKSEIIQVKSIKKNERVGYSLNYKAENDELIGIIPIGYADGIIRKNTGRFVSINNKKYPIIGNICMDMLIVKIDDTIKVNDIVTIIGEDITIDYIANYLDTICYEVICSISDRVPRIYIKDGKEITLKSNRFK